MNASPEGISVVIPARNEASSIEGVLQELTAALRLLPPTWPHEVLVIDDGSADNTAALARACGARVVSFSVGRGYGAALKRGVREAAFETIVILDGDGSYPPAGVPGMVTAVAEGAEQVIGVRRAEGDAVPVLRAFGKRLVTRFASLVTRYEIPDLNSGMRAFRRTRVLGVLRAMPDGFSFTTTLTVAALLDRWEVRWFPVEYRKRTGRSKFRPIADTARLLLSLLRAVVYFDPLKLFGPIAVGLGLTATVFAAWDIGWERNLTDKTVLLSLSAVEVFVLGLLGDMIVRKL